MSLITSMTPEEAKRFEQWVEDNRDHPAYGRMIAAGTELYALIINVERKAREHRGKAHKRKR